MEEKSGVYRVFGGKTGRKNLFGKTKRRYNNNNKIDLEEGGLWNMDWICLAQDRDSWRDLIIAVMNHRVP
jgi:hypothetical protein